MKIGIITFEFNFNYGAILQATALSDFLKLNGHEVKIVNRSWGNFATITGGGGNLLNIKYLLSRIIGRYYSTASLLNFKSKHWRLTSPIKNENDYDRAYSEFDVLITGSDQIWNSACIPTMGLHYFGINADTSKQRLIAYAPSFGKNRFEASTDDIETLKNHLKQFIAISVRESDGINLLKNRFDYHDAVRVLDPTMLMSKDYYLKLAGIKKLKTKKTLAYYILDITPDKMRFIKETALRHHLKPVNMYLPENNGIPLIGKLKSHKYPSVENWIKNIAESEMVITDSFHGTVFSIIFNRDFFTFGNEARGNSRFDNLLSLFGLNERLIEAADDNSNTNKHIDYKPVNAILEKYRQKSQSFLLDALK